MNESFLRVENDFGLVFDFGIDLDIVVNLDFRGLTKYKALFEERFVNVL